MRVADATSSRLREAMLAIGDLPGHVQGQPMLLEVAHRVGLWIEA